MKKITIINAYAKKNIGDASILESSINFLDEHYESKKEVTILCESEKSFSLESTSRSNYDLKQMPYGYAISSKENRAPEYKKMSRFIYMFLGTGIVMFLDFLHLKPLPQSGKFSYILAIKDADSVYGMGGGYLISTHWWKDYFGLLLTLLPIYISKIYKKKIIFFPMSFGPFASNIHKNISAHALQNTTVISRESISTKLLKQADKNRKILILEYPDMALNLSFKPVLDDQIKFNSNYIVLTAREWLSNEEQVKFEHELSRFVDHIWSSSKIKTKFIPMAYNKIEDDDNFVAKRIKSQLKHKEAFEVLHPDVPKDVQKIINRAKFSVCTRMHSAILSFTTRTPFISIGYGHKAKGLMNQLSLSSWFVQIDKVRSTFLVERANVLQNSQTYFQYRKNMTEEQDKLKTIFYKMHKRV